MAFIAPTLSRSGSVGSDSKIKRRLVVFASSSYFAERINLLQGQGELSIQLLRSTPKPGSAYLGGLSASRAQ